jgi:hypothetical protein
MKSETAAASRFGFIKRDFPVFDDENFSFFIKISPEK